MAKTVSTTLGEVIVVEMELTKEDSGCRWNLKWIPAELQFLEQQVINAEDNRKKQRFLFLTVAEPVGAMTKLCLVLQSDEGLDDIKNTEEITVIWNVDLKFVSYNPNDEGQRSQNAVMKYGFPCVAQTAKPYGLYYGGDSSSLNNDLPFIHRNDLPFIHKNDLPFIFNGNSYDGLPRMAYGYPCVAQATIPYGVFGSNTDMIYGYPDIAGMKYGYACTAQTSVPYGYCAPVDAGMKYGYACNAQASMPYGYSFPNYNGK